MTRQANARLAGIAYLAYIAFAFPSMNMLARMSRGDAATQLATIARQASDFRLAIVLSMLGSFCALILAVTLWAVTRDEDSEIAMLGLAFRVSEGVTGGVAGAAMLGLLAAATSDTAIAAQPLATFVLRQGELIPATFFAVGSTCFCSLLLRSRALPVALAWLGVIGSVIIAIALPLQMLGALRGPWWQLIWLPIAAFEIVGAFWLIIKGVAPPRVRAVVPA